MGISDEIEATTIVIDEGMILEIKATIAFISINFDNVSCAILATESAKSALQVHIFCFADSPVTWAERQRKDSRRSGMSQTCFRMPQSESGISSRYLDITSSSLIYSLFYSRKK